MNIKKLFGWGLNSLSGKIHRIVYRPKRSASPLADRILADALRLAELPSPSGGEEKRTAFVRERLAAAGLVPVTIKGKGGGLLVRLDPPGAKKGPPVLLYTGLRSYRWHPTESLARLDRKNAEGAGLSGALGPAALLSLAERITSGRLRVTCGVVLFFSVLSPADPENQYRTLLDELGEKPAAAVGLRGFSLGLIIRPRAFCRQRITLTPSAKQSAKSGEYAAADTAASLGGYLLEKGRESGVDFHIRRMEGGGPGGDGEGQAVLETDTEAPDGGLLAGFTDLVTAGAERLAGEAGIGADVRILSFVSPGDPVVSRGLFDILLPVMRRERVKIREEDGMDTAGLFSAEGIPALSLGLALGKAEASRDIVDITSVEKGRRLLERFIVSMGEKL
ncbi:MAG: hypothetical protein LBI86_01970 [Treponema sp.]|jgi:hypothetical protein|nr:hypothetical protein [Treponema sp.]